MNIDPGSLGRLHFLLRVVRKECAHLKGTDERLFREPFTRDTAARLASDPELAERVDAFSTRFARLQDTLGDKLLPVLLQALGETTGAVIDNLDRAERLGLIESSDQWMMLRKPRNQMVHDYIEDPVVLADALQTAHDHVASLTRAAEQMIREANRRGWGENSDPPGGG